MSAHTPGPWEVRQHSYGDHRDADGIFPVGQILNIVPCVYGRTLEQCDANARLIAAAPELLAALSRVVAVMDGSQMRCIAAARAALAKAGV